MSRRRRFTDSGGVRVAKVAVCRGAVPDRGRYGDEPTKPPRDERTSSGNHNCSARPVTAHLPIPTN